VVQKIKRSGGFKKVGHTGTLDPLAEGVLVILTDADTKRQGEFMGLKKEYLVKIAFGYESDSHDLGTTIRTAGKNIADNLTRKALSAALANYIGKIRQQVPAYSAVHVKGERLYKIARSNASINLPLPYKEIEIYDINICSFKNNEQLNCSVCTTAEIKIICGKGTYIRSLVRDLGRDLGCGAVAALLVRTRVGGYGIEDSLPPDKVILNFKGFFQNYRNQVSVPRAG